MATELVLVNETLIFELKKNDEPIMKNTKAYAVFVLM
jgi:hypothetical protein